MVTPILFLLASFNKNLVTNKSSCYVKCHFIVCCSLSHKSSCCVKCHSYCLKAIKSMNSNQLNYVQI